MNNIPVNEYRAHTFDVVPMSPHIVRFLFSYCLVLNVPLYQMERAGRVAAVAVSVCFVGGGCCG